MGEPLDEQYIKWLYRQVASVRLRNPARTYWSLIKLLYTKEFAWFVPNDDNRAADGRDLRKEFLDEIGLPPDSEWLGLGCSMLELLIGIARRLSFDTERETHEWFWELLDNLGLVQHFSDVYFVSSNHTDYVNKILDQVIERTYAADGHGGLFPLQDTDQDQRTQELWYQLNAYLLERG